MKTAGPKYTYLSPEHRRIICDMLVKPPVSSIRGKHVLARVKKHCPRGLR